MENKKPRVVLLYRVSSKKQVDKNEDGETDIPLQREMLVPWAERQGWEFVKEFIEDGVSGFKTATDKRDKLTQIKAMADRGEFDILGIYMSDRLGRIADETPLVVSYLHARGIKVISYIEGEIKADTHEDKLMLYIRYWQAEGESRKTAARIRDANEFSVKQGRWRGGIAPLGYRMVSRGTLNHKGRPVFDIEIDPERAETVKTIFRLFTKENYGSNGIAKYLNDRDIPTYEGKLWMASRVRFVLKNKLYIGINELGKHEKSNRTRVDSPRMEDLVIISDDEFNHAQALIKEYNEKHKKTKRPTRRGSQLLTGLLYCGCGQKFTSQYDRQKWQRKDGTVGEHESVKYRCLSYQRPREGIKCHYKYHPIEVLDFLVTRDAKSFIKGLDMQKLLMSHAETLAEQKQELSTRHMTLNREISSKEREIQKLKDEVMKAILGQGNFSQSLLSDMIQTREQELVTLKAKFAESTEELETISRELSFRRQSAEDLSNWEQKFDAQDLLSRKAMLINIINQVDVLEDRLKVKYKIRLSDCEHEIVREDDPQGDDSGNSDGNGVFWGNFSVNREQRAKCLQSDLTICALRKTPCELTKVMTSKTPMTLRPKTRKATAQCRCSV